MRMSICFFLTLVFVTSIYANNPNPPASTARLVFIHHSVGEDWLGTGGLRQALNNNNYYVTDTNYGWGPDGIGDRTDIGHWYDWFLGTSRDTYLDALYANNHLTDAVGSNDIANPGGSNTVVMFKSCFPNGMVSGGNPNDPPLPEGESNPIWGDWSGSENYTVSNIKGLYRDLLAYFATRQDKLFIYITTPPSVNVDAETAARHRGVCSWLVNNLLANYPHDNVFVFDYYNVLTSNGGDQFTNDLGAETGNHHRFRNGQIEHVIGLDSDLLAYDQWGDDHPSAAGHQKATGEFVPLLNVAYNRWQSNTYYVSPDGDNGNPGTYDEPWATPGYGSRQLQAGDTLIIHGGRYTLNVYDEDIITPPNSGTADAWVTIRGEEGNTPVLAGRDNLFSAIVLEGVSYIRIENLEITSDNGALFREGINATGNEISNVVFRQLHIHHIDEFGINMGDVNNLLIDECNIHYCGFGAIGGPAGQTGGWRNVLIQNCNLSYGGHYYQGGDGSNRPYDRPDGFGIEPSAGPIEIVDCIAEHNRGDGLDSKAANTYIHDCIVANNSCDGVKLWGDGSRVHNCLIYGTGDGVAGSTPWAALVIGTQTQDAQFEIVNVTIHDTPLTQNYPMYVQYDNSTPIALVMRNSTVANGYGAVYIHDSVNFTADHNVFYRPGEDVQVEANGREYTAQQIEAGELGEGNLSRDPLFVAPAWGDTGDYHLRDDSPCIGVGIMTQGVPSTDIEGNPRPDPSGSTPDVGAYENPLGHPVEDTIPPAAVTDLSVTPGSVGNTVDLEWTAPGDTKSSRATSAYIIRYNTVAITESNWDESSDVDGEPTPGTAGSTERMTVMVPYPNVTYYFAIKTQDDASNTSDISNIPSAAAVTIYLYAGWNLVTFMSSTVMSIADAMSSIPDSYTSIWRYDASVSGWLRYIVGGPTFLNNLNEMGPGYGYWIHVTEDCTWDFGGGVVPSPSRSTIRKPPFTLYGKVQHSIVGDGFTSSRIQHPESVSLKIGDVEAGSYVLGSNPCYGDHYVLEIPVDGAFREGDIAQIYVDGASAGGNPIKLGGIGTINRHDVSYVYKPTATKLLQNYPNPFNPETWIPYQLVEDSEVVIGIYNVNGQLIRTMNLGYRRSGSYVTKDAAAYWDGKTDTGERASSGVYLYNLQTGNYSATKKMIVTQ